MKFEDFEALIETYGADKARWPEDKRVAMQRIIEAHPEQAKAVMDAAGVLDGMLDEVPSAPASELLKARIQNSATNSLQVSQIETVRSRSTSGWAKIAAMIAVSFSAGFGGAQFVELPQGTDRSAPVLMASVETGVDDEWAVAATELGFEDIYEWTSGEEIDVVINDL